MSRTKDALIDAMNEQNETIPCYNCAFYFEWDVGECLLEHNDIMLDVPFYEITSLFDEGSKPTTCIYYRSVEWLRSKLIDVGKWKNASKFNRYRSQWWAIHSWWCSPSTQDRHIDRFAILVRNARHRCINSGDM